MSSRSPFRSSAKRPLRLRLRADLVARQQDYLGRRYWVVKDPLSLKYYRFEEEEYALLQWVDGQRSLEQIRREFERRFAPQRITVGEIHQFLGAMHRAAIVVSDAPGQGPELEKRRRERSRREWLSLLSNLLCIRFKGFDPDRLLGKMNRWLGWLFSTPAVIVGLLLALAAACLVTVQWELFRARLPDFQEFFAARNWFWLALTLGLTKVLHEFGHGLTCKRFGGECHEMGVMLLVLTPCVYCNVSDSWMLPSKWRRAAIGAAGMYVEIVLASICTFLWWFSEPGLFNYLCLNVIFVCSVSTLLFNANPLMRYDGYYILSDLMEIPNLRQKASTIVGQKAAAWMLGIPEPYDPFLPVQRRWFFAAYSIAAGIYRWVIVVSILWFLYRVFEPYGLQVLGQAIACASLASLIVQPVWRAIRFLNTPGRWEQVNKTRLLISLGVAAGLLAGVLWIPTPHYVRCAVHLRPRGATPVYVESPGILEQTHVTTGQKVARGQPLVTLENLEIQLRINELEGQRAQVVARIANLENLALLGQATADLKVDELKQTLNSLDKQLADQRREQQQLLVRAPASGVVIAAGGRTRKPGPRTRLAAWSGLPIDRRNQGAAFSEGQQLCLIGDPSQLTAILLIDQQQLESVRIDQPVEILLEQSPGVRRTTRVQHISERPVRTTPRALAARFGGPIPTRTTPEGEAPLETTYYVSAPLSDTSGRLFIGATGTARIRAGSLTLGQRLWRAILYTFRVEL